MKDELTTYAENTWCPGCGNFGIFNAFKRAIRVLEKKGMKNRIVISAGIGCHGKIFDYLNLSGVYSLHGRSVATIQGIKIANPELKVVSFIGDGDAIGEGIAHLIFAAKRNADITVIMHDNGVYALTTGQFTPTSQKGFKSKSSPEGNIEEPLNPITLMLESGATFVARGYAGKLKHLSDLMIQAIQHEGFSFIDVLQPCVSFNNTYQFYNKRVEEIDHDLTYEEAIELARMREKIPIGIFYRAKKPVYHKQLYGDWNPMEKKIEWKKRLKILNEILGD